MLIRPSTCNGCTLHPEATGFMYPEGHPKLGVTLMGEALGEKEAEKGLPFQGPAGFRFERMIERAGYTRDQFQILNAVFCQPPHNRMPMPGEVDHCRQYWEPIVTQSNTKVIVPMGNVPLGATLDGDYTGILSKRGYVYWSDAYNAFILPTVHPSYIMRGNSNWEAAFMYDLRHAVEVAREGWIPITRDYTLDPTPLGAFQWLSHLRSVWHPGLYLGTDIETPEKESMGEDELDISLGYLAGVIHRIGFAYRHPVSGRTHALTVPWTPSYLEVIQAILLSGCDLIFANRHFDVPRIKAHGFTLSTIRDIQEAWHVLHSDLPKKLEFITPFLVPNQPAWKHLNHGDTAAYYNAVDASVQVEGMLRLKDLLTEHGMWSLYDYDIHDLNTILIFMADKGMPVDTDRRKHSSLTCMELMEDAKERINKTAQGARPVKIYKKFKAGLESTTITVEEKYCSECGKKANKTHPHFRYNPAVPGEVPVGELCVRQVQQLGYILPLDFKPSQKGLIRYAQFMGYRLITRWDKDTQSRRVSMDETAVRQYALQHEFDPMWPLVLEYKELQTLLTRYIGTLKEDPPRTREWKWEPKEPVVQEDDDIPF